MTEDRIDHSFNIWGAHLKWLEEMAARYDLPDADKALRVLVEYAMQDGDADEIFENVRCHHCG
ncbi:MAG: hypothetical protein R3A51_09930 [Nannocystaceae bacterium]|nr:hypothetical protein [Myxococcales bacterium]